MSPTLAVVLTAVFIVVVLGWEAHKFGRQSAALWIPVAWLSITGSRFVGQWLSLGSVGGGAVMTDGTAIDVVFFLACIIGSLVILVRRGIGLGDVVRNNGWVIAFLLLGLLAVLWSDFHFIAFKRWIKILGHPLVALVILTDPEPKKALITVMKRCALFLLTVSVLFIKYFPEYGRGFDQWTGEAFNNGVGLNKNGLGYISLVCGLFFFWYWLVARKIENARLRRAEIVISWCFIGMSLWLLNSSDSATSLVTFLIGVATILVLGWPVVNKQHIGKYVLVAVAACLLIELFFDAYANVLRLLERDPNLTDRTAVWTDAISMQPNTWLGAGFESFWLGGRRDALWAKWWWHPTQAHNGYIETYLNLGIVGLVMLAGLLFSTFRKACRRLETDFDMGRLSLAILFVTLFYNYTEATFTGVHFMWTVFFLVALDCPPRREKMGFLGGGRKVEYSTGNATSPVRLLRNSSPRSNRGSMV